MTARAEGVWQERKERGNEALLRIMIWVMRTLGRPVIRVLLVPIVAYFVAFAPAARVASGKFLGRALGRKPGIVDIYRNVYAFGMTIADRVLFLTGRFEAFDIRLYGIEAFDAVLASGSGCVLIGSHLGSFEALRSAGIHWTGRDVCMMMDNANARMVTRVFAELNPRLAASIINVGEPSCLLRAHERIESGALVGMLGDRVRAGDRAIYCPFMGDLIALPAGPFVAAGMLNAPVVLCFGLYRGGNRYDIHFEAFRERIALPRVGRAAAVAALAREYARRLEHYARLAPYNWFNWFDVWDVPLEARQDLQP